MHIHMEACFHNWIKRVIVTFSLYISQFWLFLRFAWYELTIASFKVRIVSISLDSEKKKSE